MQFGWGCRVVRVSGGAVERPQGHPSRAVDADPRPRSGLGRELQVEHDGAVVVLAERRFEQARCDRRDVLPLEATCSFAQRELDPVLVQAQLGPTPGEGWDQQVDDGGSAAKKPTVCKAPGSCQPSPKVMMPVHISASVHMIT